MPADLPVIFGVKTYFSLLLLRGETNPFRTLGFIPEDGRMMTDNESDRDTDELNERGIR